MSAHRAIDLVDELGSLAAGAAPPLLDDSDARRIVERAIAKAATARPARRSFGWAIAVPAIALAIAIAGVWLVVRSPAPAAEPELLRVTLPTGDRLVGMAGAAFDLERLAPEDRRLRLRRGTMLFDVAHVVAEQRFAVATPQLVVIAKGTVFSVETDAIRTRVRVYEGAVEIEQDGRTAALEPGAIWDSRARGASIAFAPPAALSAAIEDAVRARAATPRATPTPPAPAAAPRVVAAPPPAPIAPPAPRDRAPAPSIDSLDRLLAIARADVAAGKLDDALATVKRAAARGPLTGPWWLVSADALRGLGRAAEAADAFDAAAVELTGADRVEAGYTAAYVRFHDLRDPGAALGSLDAADADADGSALEERALALRVQILEALDRPDDARAIAARYLDRFPRADLSSYMRSISTPSRR